MSFDINQVLNDMAAAITGTVQQGAGNIKDYADQILEKEKDSLKELAEARLRQEISEAEFDVEIEREKQVVEAELLTLQIMTKALAQQAVNAAINVFVKAVKAAVRV